MRPVKPSRTRSVERKQDPKRSATAKQETLRRQKVRDAKRGGSSRHDNLGRAEL